MRLPPLRFTLSALTISFFGTAGYAYNSIMNQPQALFEEFVNGSYFRHYGYHLSSEDLSTLWGAIAAMVDIGGLLGGLIIGWIAESCGRRGGVFVVSPLFMMCGAVLQLLGMSTGTWELLLVGRLITGVTIGLTNLVFMFLTECAPTYCRGLFGAMPALFMALWVLIGTVIGLPSVLGSKGKLSYLVGYGLLPGLASLCLWRAFPESPKYLFITKKDTERAIRSICFYHGNNENVEEILAEFQREDFLANQEKSASFASIFRQRHLRKAFFIATITILSIDFSGIDIALQYSNTVLQSIGLDPNTTDVSVIVTQIPGLVFCVIALLLIESFGRRNLLLTALVAGIVGNLLFFFASSVPALSVPGLILVYANHHGGLSPVGNVIAGEVCPQASRSKTASVAWVINWLGSVIIVFAFPPLQKLIGSYVFIIFVILCFVVLLWAYFELPETRQRSVDEIVGEWVNSSDDSDSDEENDVIFGEKTRLLRSVSKIERMRRHFYATSPPNMADLNTGK